MIVNRIRPLVICILRKADRILVEHGFDSVKDQHFFRPPGGAIEFGETAAEALGREFREELGAELSGACIISVLENIFVYEGKPGHEIVFVFEASFANRAFYDRDELVINEPGVVGVASWKSLEEMRASGHPLYPDGLSDLLRS